MIKLLIIFRRFLLIHSLESKFKFQLTLFISNSANFAERKTSLKLTLYLRREYHLEVRLRKFNLLNTSLREITNNIIAAKIVKSLSKHIQLQKTIYVQHGAVIAQIMQDFCTTYLFDFTTSKALSINNTLSEDNFSMIGTRRLQTWGNEPWDHLSLDCAQYKTRFLTNNKRKFDQTSNN